MVLSDGTLKLITDMYDKETRTRIESNKENSGVLEEIVDFFRDCQVEDDSSGSYKTGRGKEWFGHGQRFNIDETKKKELYRHIATCKDLGVPLSLSEILTSEFQFFVTIKFAFKPLEWQSGAQQKVRDYVLNASKPILDSIGTVLKEHYPNQSIFMICWASMNDASLSLQGREFIAFVSCRDIIVDSDRAVSLLRAVKSRCDTHENNAELRALGDQCSFAEAMDDKQYRPNKGEQETAVRMPFCDTMHERKHDMRPFVPVGVLRAATDGSLAWVVGKSSDNPVDKWPKEGWMSQSQLRRRQGTPLTEWTPPLKAKSQFVGHERQRTHKGSD